MLTNNETTVFNYRPELAQPTRDIAEFVYAPPRINYTDEQADFLGLFDGRVEKDEAIPTGTTFGDGIRNVLLGVWLNEFNPIENSPAVRRENPDSAFFPAPTFKPITDLNRQKAATKAIALKYIESLTETGNAMVSFAYDSRLSQDGVWAKQQEFASEFFEQRINGFLLDQFRKNEKVIFDELSRVLTPPEQPETPQEALIDIEIRSIYRANEELRRNAIFDRISPRHDLALARAEAAISGFSQSHFDLIFFKSAIRRNIASSYQVDILFSINCYLWLIAHRSAVAMLDFAHFQEPDKDAILSRYGLNWKGNNAMSAYENVLNFLITSNEAPQIITNA